MSNPTMSQDESPADTNHVATSLARFEALFEQVPVPMIIVGLDWSTTFNQAALELFGRDHDELTSLSFRPGAPWIPADQEEAWAEMRRGVAAGERTTGRRFALIRASGERREVEGSSIPVVMPGGGSGGVITVLTDLTDRLSLEGKFRHAQKMEALGRLAGGVAHDFNNILMAIVGYAEFIARDSRDGAVDPAHADHVVTAARRAIDLTARLTAFARREASRLEAVDVAQTVESVMPILKRLAPESIEIAVHLEPGSSVVLDRSELEMVVVNLVVNAVDAMPDGGRLTLEVGLVDLDAAHETTHLGQIAGRHVLVAVSDTGTGMDAATRARIFEPFYTTKGMGEGTGLGLAMVFAAVERAMGTIWVYSEPGHGTTFKIYLPLADPELTGAPRDVESPAAPVGGSESILLLEDDASVRDLVTTVLQELGYDLSVATRPSEAFALADARHFDLLVSDVVMPEMTGDAVAARLRESQPGLPVVFMSGYTASALEFSLGPRDSLVHKPLAPSEVGRVVRDAMDRFPRSR
ncbi:MAG: two-component system, cell cycle sensor histidine kinase and response regulator CckA [Chloroflexota bacterium]|nr:two-component system, cell cycle sensor histidine kinase and response regulator CckA [Chloroflexota bacterium]